MTVPINYLAVVVAAAVGFILGWIWYAPLFGKAWRASRGVTEQQAAEGQKHAARTMLVIAVAILFMAWSLAVLAGYLKLGTWMQGAKLGALTWFGFALALGMIEATMAVGRTMVAFCIDAGYWLITAVAMGVVVAVWH